MRHNMESCDQSGEDQDKTWLDGPVASVKGKLSDDLAPMDRGNGEEQVKLRSMNQYGSVQYVTILTMLAILHALDDRVYRQWGACDDS